MRSIAVRKHPAENGRLVYRYEEAIGWQAAGSALDNVDLGRSLVVKEMNYIYS